jgi:histidine triad (HIT) family protein
MPAACIFCSIISGATPAALVYEDEHCLAFLDNRPLFPGHCLLVPRDHHQTIGDLPANLGGPLFAAVQRITRAVESAMNAEGTFVAMNNRVSQSVPHLHVHIVPRRRKDGLKGFFWPRYAYKDQAEMEAVREAIRKAIAG